MKMIKYNKNLISRVIYKIKGIFTRKIDHICIACPVCGWQYELGVEHIEKFNKSGLICHRCEINIGEETHSAEEIEIAKRKAHIYDLLHNLYEQISGQNPSPLDDIQIREGETAEECHNRYKFLEEKHQNDIKNTCVEQVKTYIKSADENNDYYKFYRFVHDNNIELSDYMKPYFDNND